MALSALTKVGIAKEATWGAGGTPVLILPVEPPSFNIPSEQILDQALRGIAAMDFAAYQGALSAEASLSGPFYPNECGFFLNGIMGTATVTGGTPSVHTFALAAVAPSFIVQDEHGIDVHRFVGMHVAELTLTFNNAEGLLTYSASLTGAEKTDVGACGLSAQIASTTSPFRGWMGSARIGGDDWGELLEGEITLSREVELHYTGGNTQVPQSASLGPLEVTGRVTTRYTAVADYDRYLDKTQESFQIDWAYGADAALRSLRFLATVMDFGDGPVETDRSGNSITLAYTMRALYNSTDAGPCVFTLKNMISGYGPSLEYEA